MMFENLSLRGFTWNREPVLYVTLAVAILQVVVTIMTGDIALADGAMTIMTLVFGFIVRGEVTPTSKL